MTRKTLALALAVLSIAGCKLSVDAPPYKPISIVTVRQLVNPGSPTGFTGKAFAYFFSERGFTYSDSRFASNSCAGPQVVGVGNTPARWVEPGQPVTMTLQGTANPTPRTVTLTKGGAGEPDPNVYVNVTQPTLYAGTDSSTITVPGAAGGFPAIQVSAQTVQDFTFDPVPDSGTVAGGLPIKWTASTNSNTAMELVLLYKSDAAQTTKNLQIVCTMVDDGDFSVPRQFLDGWEKGGDDDTPLDREVRMSRYITKAATAGDATILLLNAIEKTALK